MTVKHDQSLMHLYYPVRVMVHTVVCRAFRHGLRVWPYETLRSFERQQHLHDIGASKTLNSWHLYGLAVDLYPINERGFLGGKALKKWYDKNGIVLAMNAEAMGMEWGGNWKTFHDPVHFEISFGTDRTVLAHILERNGIKAVWRFLDHWRENQKNLNNVLEGSENGEST